jgi:hypothetical protein
MTREEFIKILDEKKYSYKIEGDKIVVTHRGIVWLDSIESLPPGVQFKNGGYVNLRSLKSLPPGVQFENRGYVNLRSLTSLPPGVQFNNGESVYLGSLKSLPPGVEFKNGGDIYFGSLIGGWFNDWSGNIRGVHKKRMLNFMIKKGIFER